MSEAALSSEQPELSVTITAWDIFFEPKELEIPADTTVEIVVVNEGAAPHNFSVDALDISIDVAPGETESVVIEAPTGEYEFYCNVPGHREAGMVGTLLVVLEPSSTISEVSAADNAGYAIVALPVPAGAIESQALGVANTNRIAGSFSNASGGEEQAIVWTEVGAELLAAPAGVESVAADVNESGVVVGWVIDPEGDSLPSVWVDGDQRTLDSSAPGGYASAINNRDQISGAIGPEWDRTSAYVLVSRFCGLIPSWSWRGPESGLGHQ